MGTPLIKSSPRRPVADGSQRAPPSWWRFIPRDQAPGSLENGKGDPRWCCHDVPVEPQSSVYLLFIFLEYTLHHKSSRTYVNDSIITKQSTQLTQHPLYIFSGIKALTVPGISASRLSVKAYLLLHIIYDKTISSPNPPTTCISQRSQRSPWSWLAQQLHL
ncbi:hypothetical protein BDV97DRAFT_358982 [Delphinella strobiligena]|nr:hypothetical protein BDV97DRAFT_358982 [Delphinella strobiligena]